VSDVRRLVVFGMIPSPGEDGRSFLRFSPQVVLMSRADLASVLAQVSHELAGERDETLTATRICELAVEVVDGCDHATLVVRGRRGRLVLAAATSEEVRVLEQRQLDEGTATRTGPTLDAFESADPVVCDDLGAEPRWPGWSAAAVELGVCSLFALPLVSSDARRTQAVMTLHARATGTWSGPAADVAMLYATHAAAALDAAKIITGLESALGTRHQIGVAQGILMERHGLSAGRAFAVLQRYSSTRNERLSDVAAQVVADVEAAAGSPAPREP
jgi:GAF domain-containing protein